MKQIQSPNSMENLHLDAVWTDDVCGKKSYDGNIVQLDTRYWPYDATAGKVSAKSSVLLVHEEADLELASEEFSADTFEEVKLQVEKWSQQQMDRVVKALLEEFKPKA